MTQTLTKKTCSCCNEKHPADQGISLYVRKFKCSECGHEWIDVWCSDCDDRCPECNSETVPLEGSEEIVIEEPIS